MIGEMAKMYSELKEVKEKLCTLTAAVGENKDEGRLNYAIKVIQLILILSRSQHVLNETEKSSHLEEMRFFQLKQFLEKSLQSPFIILLSPFMGSSHQCFKCGAQVTTGHHNFIAIAVLNCLSCDI